MRNKYSLSEWQRKRAIKSYMKELPELLQSRYGAADYYTTGQVKTTIKEYSLYREHAHYAIAMFCNPQEITQNPNINKTFESIRKFLAETYFGGNTGFSVVDVKALAASSWLSESGFIDGVFGGVDDGSGFGDGGGGGDG